MTHAQHSAAPAYAAFSLTGLHCTGCADSVERVLRANPHITSVHIDWPNSVAHVGYHAELIDEPAIWGMIEATGCPCADGEHANGGEGHQQQHEGAVAQARLRNLRHGVDVLPITMGTRHDRMQYELPATTAHAQHATNAAAARSDGHAGMEHSQHAGMDHSDMGHDMSDPGMAAAMERDMRTRFFIALALTIPTVLYSPMGLNLLGIRLPSFGLSMDLIMLVLTTPVVFYAGWIFIAGAYHSLRRRALNMSVLVATGVLAAYGGSLALMALSQETFFEAAAMLVTFVLFGHWMEMRSRRGTSDALRALFDRERGLALAEASQFDSIPGHGISATVDGRALLIGNRKLMRDQGVDAAALDTRAAELASAGKTPMYVAVDGRAAGLVAVADTIKPTAAETIRRLMAAGIEPVMITGDNWRTAEAVARELGIARFFAEVLPADKASHVKALQAEGRRVAMVGDGVNDAPALAQADTGIAIGAGTDVAIETADVVLMKSDPLDILNAITISQATVRKMKQNLFWAAIYNVLAIPVAAGVFYPSLGLELRPEWAALLMSASSIIVAVNALMLRNVERELHGPSQPQPATDRRPVSVT